MNLRYNVFWIDDNHKKQEAFKELASEKGIDFTCYRSLEGLNHLFINFREYDAVLLDVRIVETEDSYETPNSEYAMKAKAEIEKFPHKKFKIVFFSGESEIFSNEKGFKKFVKDYPLLDKQKDNIKCINTLLENAKSQPLFQIKEKNRDFFDAANKILPHECSHTILTVLSDNQHEFKGYLNQIRKILEEVFRALIKGGVVPDFANINSPGWLSSCSRFLSGQAVFSLEKSFEVPRKIIESTRFVLKSISSPASHTFDFDKENKHLNLGTCYLLMDIVIWAEKLIRTHSKENWRCFEKKGIIKSINYEKNYGFISNNDFSEDKLYFKIKENNIENKIKVGSEINFDVISSYDNKEKKWRYSAINIQF